MTIYDVSEKAGVSIATVSRVLNGSNNVSEKTKAKVLAVMNECDYTPNAFARGLGLNTMQTIGILCADSSDLYLAKAVYYIEQSLRQNGYDSLLCCTGYDQSIKKKYLNLLISKKVDSVILIGSNFIGAKDSENAYIKTAANQVPVMLLNGSLDHPNVYSTLCDDFQAMYNVTNNMISEGIQDILYLYNSSSFSGRKKLAGYKTAMETAGLARPELMQLYNGSVDSINDIVAFLRKKDEEGLRYRGVVTSEDRLAIGALKFAQEKGLSIPDDVAIVGYNNSMLAQCCIPELTSVDSRLETLCNQLVNTLMGVLSGKEMPKQTVFSGEIIKRGTTL